MSAAGLGRKPSPPDPRDHRFLMREITPTPDVHARTWISPLPVLDQDGTSQCVAYSGIKYLMTYPVRNRPKQTPAEIYGECLKVDEWPGEDWDGGTSVRALFKVLTRLGYVSEYRWAFDFETVVDHVLTRGPVVMGTSWLRNMFMPHIRTGYLECAGRNDGGHAWLIIGANRKKKNPDGTVGAVRMINSWGDKWGQKGRAWITFQDLEKLIKDDGEACVSSEIKISRAMSWTDSA